MPDFSETLIREHSSPESFRRGREYYQRGSVTSLTRRGEELRAEVMGSAPYDVRVHFDAAGITEVSCTCPYDWGGWCKHIVAVLLCTVHEPESVQELPTLGEALSGLDREQLESVLLRLAHDPQLAGAIEKEVSSLAPQAVPQATSAQAGRAARAAVDVGSIRYQVHSIIRSLEYMRPSEAYWHVGGAVDEVRRVLDGARDFIEAGEARNALLVLEAVTDEYTEAWEYLDDSDGEVGDFFHELGAVWTEALLSADLSHPERQDWISKLQGWWEELELYAGGEAFEAALLATERGWDDAPLLQVLEGAAPEQEEDHGDELTVARLGVLERQGRYEEYLRLAGHVGEVRRYAVMLVRLYRYEEAIEYGLERLDAAEEALAVAQALREHGKLESALRIGEHGLALAGWKSALAAWVRDLASGMGHPEQALEAASIAFHQDPALASYLRLQELAGESWPEYRAELLDHLRKSTSYYPAGHVEVFLYEGLAEDAIAVVERSPDKALLERVAGAAVESHPDWVIRTCRRQAEGIMDRGKARHYHRAVEWLKKVKAAHRAAGREEEWRAYLEELIAVHQRKYKLRLMLESLGSHGR